MSRSLNHHNPQELSTFARSASYHLINTRSPCPLAMVSYPESVDHAAAPPSSASRLSVSHSSRRPHHRHGHSHHGGASYQPHNDFPIFSQTGDVEIIISSNGQERRYLLHRLILAQCSSFFEASTSDALSPLGPTRDDGPSESNPSLPSFPEDGASSVVSGRTSLQNGAPPRKRWRFELDWDNRDGDEPPILVQRVCKHYYFQAGEARR